MYRSAGEIPLRVNAGAKNLTVGLSLEGTVRRAGSADRLATARQIALFGDVAGGAAFDGSRDVSIRTAVAVLTNEELEAMLK
ncbi:MAG: hypothetical protein MR842_13290 [Clostridiales bacterium]|nr:hypothetical protein [Clostridiales bacterium]MDO4349851.1 hypothetical protein [Eubacteriales bacterium]